MRYWSADPSPMDGSAPTFRRAQQGQYVLGRTDSLGAETLVSLGYGQGHPNKILLAFHEGSRETMFQGRLGPKNAQGLVRLGDRCLLNLEDEVAFSYSAIGGRAGRVHRGHFHHPFSGVPLLGN